MKNISFALTEPQFLDGTKDVTRRLGWKDLKAGDRLRAVRKGMGLKKGEKLHSLGVIEVISVRRERLDAITPEDVAREGFEGEAPASFVQMFCRHMGCSFDTEVTRIEFRRIQIVCSIDIAGEEDFRVELTNDGTGTAEIGNYNVHIFIEGHHVTPEPLRIENWPRGSSAAWLASTAMDFVIAATDAKLEKDPKPAGIDHIFGGPAPAFVHHRVALEQMRFIVPDRYRPAAPESVEVVAAPAVAQPVTAGEIL